MAFENENDTTQIGFMVNGMKILCPTCAQNMKVPVGETRLVPVYRVNIGPYKQSCHGCGKELVKGRTPAWCELFSNPDKK